MTSRTDSDEFTSPHDARLVHWPRLHGSRGISGVRAYDAIGAHRRRTLVGFPVTAPTPQRRVGRGRAEGMRLWSAQRLAVLFFALDAGIAMCVALLASLVGSTSGRFTDIQVIAGWMMTWILCAAAMGGYSRLAGFSSCRQARTIFALTARSGVTALAVCLVISVAQGQERGYFVLVAVIATLTAASGTARILLNRSAAPRILVVALNTGILPAGFGEGQTVRFLPVSAELLGRPDQLISEIREAAKSFDACAVEIVGAEGLSGHLWRSLSWELRDLHASLRFAIAGGPLRQRRVQCSVTGTRAVLEISAPAQSFAVHVGKRTTDIVGSLLLIISLAPLLAALAVVVRASSKGPALYRQERVGKDGALFNILKFRSMTDGSDEQLAALLKRQHKGETPLFKVDNDPRITRVGAILRRYSLDELPQLFNVLAGSMSLVGPRPQRPAEVALYRGDAVHRLGVRPGMTGLWQVSGRSRLTWEEAQQMDIDYAHNWSLWEDLHILSRTARAVVGRDGAV